MEKNDYSDLPISEVLNPEELQPLANALETLNISEVSKLKVKDVLTLLVNDNIGWKENAIQANDLLNEYNLDMMPKITNVVTPAAVLKILALIEGENPTKAQIEKVINQLDAETSHDGHFIKLQPTKNKTFGFYVLATKGKAKHIQRFLQDKLNKRVKPAPVTRKRPRLTEQELAAFDAPLHEKSTDNKSGGNIINFNQQAVDYNDTILTINSGIAMFVASYGLCRIIDWIVYNFVL